METLLIYEDSSSRKFWKITVKNTSYIVTYGKIGTIGSVKNKKFSSPETCQKEAEKLIQSKLKKGYRPAELSRQVIKESEMTEDVFWQLLESCQLNGDDSEEQMEWLAARLSRKPVKDILMFDAILKKHYRSSYTSKLWAAAYIAMGGCSDDCFDYFRAWVLYLGRDIYFAAIEDPETLLPYFKLLEEQEEIPQLEELLTVASDAFEEKTGLDFEDYLNLYDQLIKEDFNEPDIELDWDEDDEEGLQKMFPQLWAAYGENPM